MRKMLLLKLSGRKKPKEKYFNVLCVFEKFKLKTIKNYEKIACFTFFGVN